MAFALMTLLLLGADEPRWKLDAEPPGLKIYARQRENAEVREMKAIGLIDASPQEIWKVLSDLEGYKANMPYTAEAKVLKKENETTTLFYSRLATPLASNRDYIIRLVDESKWDDGKGFLKVSWTAVNDQDALEPEKKDVVRVRINDGYWLLEPRDNGTKTFATYYIYTSPGGSIPTFIANSANGIAVPEVFKAIKKTVAKQRAK